MNDFLEKLKMALGQDSVTEYEPMNKHITFRTGGPARYFAAPLEEDGLKGAIGLCRERGVPFYILGNGSNVLITDKGYDGVMIYMGAGFSSISVEQSAVRAGAGALLSRMANQALIYGLTGFEFAAGIPGTLGGAVVMNAGAYGGEMKQVLKSARVMTRTGEIKDLDGSELDLGYRHSCIEEKEYIVLSAVLELKPGDEVAIRSRMEELAAKRKEKQPLEYPSAGSTFKRPEGHFAGKLIEEAGLRGYRSGGAQVSEKHCGFVINRDHATAADIMELMKEVQRKVRENSGVTLEPEVRIPGNIS